MAIIKITNDNLFSKPYEKLKEFLNAITGLDPRNRFKGNWIHASMPNINQKGFDGYPFIVLKVDVNEERKAFKSSVSDKVFRIMFGVYSDDPSQLDTISDLIVSGIKDTSKLPDFQVKEVSTSPVAWNMDLNGKKILFRNIGIIARSRIGIIGPANLETIYTGYGFSTSAWNIVYSASGTYNNQTKFVNGNYSVVYFAKSDGLSYWSLAPTNSVATLKESDLYVSKLEAGGNPEGLWSGGGMVRFGLNIVGDTVGTNIGTINSSNYYGQTFLCSSCVPNYYPSKINVRVFRNGNPAGNLNLLVTDVDANNLPTNTNIPYASGSYTDTILTSSAFVDINLVHVGSRYLEYGKKYAFYLYAPTASGSDSISIWVNSPGTYTSGNDVASYNGGSTWNTLARDVLFTLYGAGG